MRANPQTRSYTKYGNKKITNVTDTIHNSHNTAITLPAENFRTLHQQQCPCSADEGRNFNLRVGDAIKLARDRVETNKWISLMCVLLILVGSVLVGLGSAL